VEGEFNTGASESRVRFSRPNKVACRELAFHVGATDFRATGLGNARCDKISLMGGAGDLTLDFTGDWGTVTRTAAEIGVGVGSVTLRLPESLGVSIRIERFLSSFDQSGFVKRGNTYYSASYDSAPTRLDLEIKAALGNIDVVWVR
jgi:predicted membrane protein